MLKKFLYIFVVVLLGLFLLLTLTSYLASNIILENINTALKEDNKTYIESIHNYVIDDERPEISYDESTGLKVDILPTITYRSIYKAEGDSVSEAYSTMENVIQVVFFNLPEGFALKDGETTVGKAVFNYEGGSATVLFDNSDKEITDYNYGVDYYSFYETYGYTYINLYEGYLDELVEEDYLTKNITSIDVFDGNEVQYTITLNTGLSFNNTLCNDFRELLVQYNGLASGAIEETDEITTDGTYKEMYNLAQEKYHLFVSMTSIYSSSKFIVWMVVAGVVYIGLAVGVGILIFKRKKNSYTPYSFTAKPKTQVQQEAFSRDVFNAAPDDLSLGTADKEENEETKEDSAEESEVKGE